MTAVSTQIAQILMVLSIVTALKDMKEMELLAQTLMNVIPKIIAVSTQIAQTLMVHTIATAHVDMKEMAKVVLILTNAQMTKIMIAALMPIVLIQMVDITAIVLQDIQEME